MLNGRVRVARRLRVAARQDPRAVVARHALERGGRRAGDGAGGGAEARPPSRGTGRTRGAPRGRRRPPPRPRAPRPARCCRRRRPAPRTGRGRRAASAWPDGTRRTRRRDRLTVAPRAVYAHAALRSAVERGASNAARGSLPPWRPDLVPPAPQPAPPWSAPPPDGIGPAPMRRARSPRADGPAQGGHHALPQPVHRPAGSRPVGGADRHDRRPDRRHRRPLSARDRPRRRAPTGARSSCPGRASSRSTTTARGCSVRTIDITKFSQRAARDPAQGVDLLDKQIVDIEGRKVIRVNDVRLDEIEGQLRVVAVDVGRRRARPPAGHRGPVPDGRPRAAPRRPRAVHRLGGRRPARQHDREHPAARPARAPGRAPPGRPRRHHRPAHAARPPRRPRLARRRGPGRRGRGDGARHAGRGARGPRARAAPPTSSRR